MHFDGQQWHTYERDIGDYLLTASDGSAWLAKGVAEWVSPPDAEALLCRVDAECYPLKIKARVDELAIAPDGALWILQGMDSQNQIVGLSRFMPNK
jgi:hypothetical protein